MRTLRTLFLCSIALWTLVPARSASAADLVWVQPVTSKILQVYVVDGKIDYFDAFQNFSNAVIYHEPVNLTAAGTLGNYTVQSSDDSNYATARSPINIGRKAKAIYYHDPFDRRRPTYVHGHRIYVELPNALVAGKTYTVKLLNGLTNNRDSVSFTYDVNKLRSETVHVNQVGFAPNSVKVGYLSHWMGDFSTTTHASGGLNLDDRTGSQFRVVNYATGAVAYTGTISKRLAKTVHESTHAEYGPEYNYSHADVWECNFSALTAPGEYVLAVDGIGCSYPFEIGADVNREPFYYAMKGLFIQRQGIVKELDGGRVYPRDHHPDDVVWRYDANWPGGEDTAAFNTASPRVQGIWGHYHDAGDWDHYNSHARVPFALLLLYDMNPAQYRDGDVGNRYKLHANDAQWINEGTNGLPDLLDEAGWLVKFYQRARNHLLSTGLGTGGVPGYVGRDGIPDNNFTAYQDTREWYVSQENVEATYNYAALAAWYAECLKKFQSSHPDIPMWTSEATAAWNWANARSTTNTAERGLAAALLYRVTGNTAYQTIYQAVYNADTTKNDGEWSNPTQTDLSMAVFAMLPSGHPGLDTMFQQTVRNKIIEKADIKVSETSANSYRCAVERNQFFLLGTFSTPRHTYITVAHHLTGGSSYLDALQHAASYQLGGNQLDTVYVSGLGEQPDNAVFDPTAWYTNPGGSLAYDDEMFDGFSTYFGAVSFWFTTSIYSELVTRDGAYPKPGQSTNQWPESESKFFNRYSIQGSEFTVHQQNNFLVYAFGYLNAQAGASTTAYVPNVRPTVSPNLTDGQSISASGTTITATASADTRLVKYYYDWHFIGQSTDKANNFPVFWAPTLSTGATTLVSAVAYDDRGRISRWSDAGDKSVVIGGGGGDVTPPANPSGLTATAVSASQINLDWADNTESDLSGYNVYRSTTSGSGYGKINGALVSSSAYSDTGLSASTTYYYVVRAVDTSSNESGNSNQANATTQSGGGGCTASATHVSSIVVTTVSVGGGSKRGQAQVTVLDNCGNPVSGATVSGTFSGSISGSASAVTNASGVATIQSTNTAKGKLNITFCVTNVSHASLSYNSAANVETCDSGS